MKNFVKYIFWIAVSYLLFFFLFSLVPFLWAYGVFVLVWAVLTFYFQKPKKEEDFNFSDLRKMFRQFKGSRKKVKEKGEVFSSAVVAHGSKKEVLFPPPAPVSEKKKPTSIKWKFVFFACIPLGIIFFIYCIPFTFSYLILSLVFKFILAVLPRRKYIIMMPMGKKRFRYSSLQKQ